jgi:hypothetical protein
LLERSTAKKASRVILKVSSRKRPGLQGQVRKYVLKGAEVHTDELHSYEGLGVHAQRHQSCGVLRARACSHKRDGELLGAFEAGNQWHVGQRRSLPPVPLSG